LSTAKINMHVQKVYENKPNQPEFKKYCIDGKKGQGFNRLELRHTDTSLDRRYEAPSRQEVRKRPFSELED
jgi:hypothetical protein